MFFFIKHLDFFNEFWDSFSRLFGFFFVVFLIFFINQESVIHPTPRLISFRLNLTQRLCTFLCFFFLYSCYVCTGSRPPRRTDRQTTDSQESSQTSNPILLCAQVLKNGFNFFFILSFGGSHMCIEILKCMYLLFL